MRFVGDTEIASMVYCHRCGLELSARMLTWVCRQQWLLHTAQRPGCQRWTFIVHRRFLRKRWTVRCSVSST